MLVRNKKTGNITYRHKRKVEPPPTEEQKELRAGFAERSRMASEWLKTNSPKVCPPLGTEEYQRMQHLFKKQDKENQLFRFIMARINKYGKVS